jgi:undecaprenyl-diphosphatase
MRDKGYATMAKVASSSVHPDISMLRGINGLARHAPHGVDRAVEAAGGYGLVVLTGLLALACWWRVARRSADAPAAVAGVLWAPLAAGLALLLDIPVRALVQRPRPYVEHDGLEVLVHGGSRYSFVSGQAAVTAAVAVALFMVSRRYGIAALLVALAEGFCQVYVGADYPTDVIGGYALGTATVLLLAPPAVALLTAPARALAPTRLAPLIRAPRPAAPQGDLDPPRRMRHSATDKDLAA